MKIIRPARLLVGVLACLLLASCIHSTATSIEDFPKLVGKEVTVEGTVAGTSLGGPTINFNGYYVLVDRPPQFASYISHKCRVTGTLIVIDDPLAPGRAAYKLVNTRWERID